ncbi:hypothetical protein Sta7437_3225 [Stanieria cyanosphaera PCC 7437]|uniref:Uncharacterized protein n=1 Tax=Stanieria cyanosphaera (strain ATCC 29371 / PCC 7437) TaxID=111780 RepID=K9XYH7_STAC7|nr:hypothetical protein [Stanieria cyanosphaera]AFZ36732.1 hypothetical protein Sta7437_3225 [Stanieria cyanosphaera PCC 7437]
MEQIIIIAIAVVNLNIPRYTLLLTTTAPSTFRSLQTNLTEQRKTKEFIDDGTEKMLNRHKKLLILIIIGFGWLTYKSLFSSQHK